MDFTQNWLNEIDKKERNGELTVDKAPISSFLKILSGEYKGRVIMKFLPFAKIDGEEVLNFADNGTWVYYEKLKDCICKRVGWRYDEV